jgi:hypothetical protein
MELLRIVLKDRKLGGTLGDLQGSLRLSAGHRLFTAVRRVRFP